MTSNILRKWFITTVLILPTHVLQPHRIWYGFSVMIQKQFFAYFRSLPWKSNISVRKTLEKIHKSYSFNEHDLKTEITLAKNLLRKDSKLPSAYIYGTIFSCYLKSCVWLILVAVTLPVTSASCERSVSKMKSVKKFPRNSMISGRLGDNDLLSVERYQLKNRFEWFRWWIDIRHDNLRIKFHWGDDDIKFQYIQECNTHLQRG